MRKKEHLKVEGLEKIRKIKASINKASTSFARFVSRYRRYLHTKLQPPGKISVNSDNATGIFSPRASSIPLQLDAANYISTKNLMAMLSDISLYNEVYDIIKSNSHLYRNISCMLGEGPTSPLRGNRELRALSVIEDGGKAPSSLLFPVGKREVCIKLKEVIFGSINRRVPSVRESIKN
jgi:hypothetical protein